MDDTFVVTSEYLMSLQTFSCHFRFYMSLQTFSVTSDFLMSYKGQGSRSQGVEGRLKNKGAEVYIRGQGSVNRRPLCWTTNLSPYIKVVISTPISSFRTHVRNLKSSEAYITFKDLTGLKAVRDDRRVGVCWAVRDEKSYDCFIWQARWVMLSRSRYIKLTLCDIF